MVPSAEQGIEAKLGEEKEPPFSHWKERLRVVPLTP